MKRILIIYASYGSGHKVVANYISKYFLEKNSNIEIKTIDLIEYSMPIIGKISRSVNIFLMTHLPFIHHIFYKSSDNIIGGYLADNISSSLFKNRKMKKFLKEYNPNLTIATHFFGSSIINYYNKKGLINSKLVTVVTDYETCELWLNDYKMDDYLIVGDKNEISYLHKRGIDKKKIKPLGIPIYPITNDNFDKDKFLNSIGIKKNRLVCVFFGGGGAGSMATIPYLKKLALKKYNIDIIFIAGGNIRAKKIIDDFLKKENINNVYTFGFVNNVPEFLQACDFVISKSGGVASTECLYYHKPILIIKTNGGPEIANYKYFTKYGYGKHFFSSWGLNNYVEKLIEKPEILKDMSNKMAQKDNRESIRMLYNLCMDLIK